MKTKKLISAELHEEYKTMTTHFYTAIYCTIDGNESGKNYLTPEAAQEEANVYCQCFNYKLLYIKENLLFLR